VVNFHSGWGSFPILPYLCNSYYIYMDKAKGRIHEGKIRGGRGAGDVVVGRG
jgi:hypothetical protein